MKKVRYKGADITYDNLTYDKVYDVIEYIVQDDYRFIAIENDKGNINTFYISYTIISNNFEDVTTKYRNETIAEILL